MSAHPAMSHLRAWIVRDWPSMRKALASCTKTALIIRVLPPADELRRCLASASYAREHHPQLESLGAFALVLKNASAHATFCKRPNRSLLEWLAARKTYRIPSRRRRRSQ